MVDVRRSVQKTDLTWHSIKRPDSLRCPSIEPKPVAGRTSSRGVRQRRRKECWGTHFFRKRLRARRPCVSRHGSLVGAGFKPARTQDVCWHATASGPEQLRQSRVLGATNWLAVNYGGMQNGWGGCGAVIFPKQVAEVMDTGSGCPNVSRCGPLPGSSSALPPCRSFETLAQHAER
jgi:hypothetical protein